MYLCAMYISRQFCRNEPISGITRRERNQIVLFRSPGAERRVPPIPLLDPATGRGVNDDEADEELDIEGPEAGLPNGHRGWTDAASSSAARGLLSSETPEASPLASRYPAATTAYFVPEPRHSFIQRDL